MFDSQKNHLVRNKYVKLLGLVIAGTASPAGCAMVPQKDADGMKAAEPSFIEVNPAIAKDGAVAVRAMQPGIDAFNAAAAASTAPPAGGTEAPKENPKYDIQADVPLPAIQRGGPRGDSTYPFDKLEKGQSFFVPATTDRPNPSKSLASTVSSATKRFKAADKEGKPTGKDGRKFTIRAVTENNVKGARIWRTS